MRLEDGDVALRPLVEADAAPLAPAARDPLVPFYIELRGARGPAAGLPPLPA